MKRRVDELQNDDRVLVADGLLLKVLDVSPLVSDPLGGDRVVTLTNEEGTLEPPLRVLFSATDYLSVTYPLLRVADGAAFVWAQSLNPGDRVLDGDKFRVVLDVVTDQESPEWLVLKLQDFEGDTFFYRQVKHNVYVRAVVIQ